MGITENGPLSGGLPRHYQKGVSMRGRVFLSKCEPHSQMLRGERGAAQIVPSCAYWGGVYPRQGGLSVVDRWD
jgi:hypothetical protein